MFKRFQPFLLQAKPVIFIVPEPEENLEPSPKKKELETGYQLQQNWAEIVSLYNYCQTVEKTLHLLYFALKRFNRLTIFISLVSICMIMCSILLGSFGKPKQNKPKSSKPKKKKQESKPKPQKQDSTKKTGTMFSVFEKNRTS